MDLGLRDKVALITGGASGIGLAIAREFLSEGCRVGIVDGVTPIDPTVNDHKNAIYCATELTDHAACSNAVEAVFTAFGRIDILVNNAGINDAVDISADPKDFEISLSRNLVHYFSMMHYSFDALKKSDVGCVVNIGSKVSVTGQGQTSGYAAAKGGVNSLSREWAVACAPYGIRVNAVIPAEVWTDMYENWLESTHNPKAMKESIERTIPLGARFTTPEEIAATVVFLASKQSSHTTGQIVFVDGGYTHLDRKCTITDS